MVGLGLVSLQKKEIRQVLVTHEKKVVGILSAFDLFRPIHADNSQRKPTMSETPTIAAYMTASPHTIGREQSLRSAHEIMRAEGIRHLPVLHGGKLVGVVSLRDLDWVESRPKVDPETIAVEEAMSSELYVVQEDAPLPDVARHMRDNRIGSAIVTRGRDVVGVFTAVDALTALCDSFDGKF